MANITNTEALIGQTGDWAGKNYSGSFIPTVWSSKILAALYEETFLSQITNTEYEGEISKYGDTVKIIKEPNINVRPYVIGAGLQNQVVEPNDTFISLDRAASFSTPINDVIAAQSLPNLLSMYSGSAARAMKEYVQTDVLIGHAAMVVGGHTVPTKNGIWNEAAAENQGAEAGKKSGAYNLGTVTAPVQLTTDTIIKTFLAMAAAMDEQNIPESDRFLLMDSATRTILMDSPAKIADAMGDQQSILRTGNVGMYDRFTLFRTNNLPSCVAGKDYLGGDATTNVAHRVLIAGHKSAIGFVSGIEKVESLRNPDDFGDILRGLNVFGFKAIRPEGIVVARVM